MSHAVILSTAKNPAKNKAYLSSWYFKSANSTTSKHFSWQASKITGGAKPASDASSQRAAQTHQRSPAFKPTKLYCGRGVLKSLPRENENAKNSSVTWQQTVWLPLSSGPVSQQPVRVKPVSGFVLQVCNVVPNTLRAIFLVQPYLKKLISIIIPKTFTIFGLAKNICDIG